MAYCDDAGEEATKVAEMATKLRVLRTRISTDVSTLGL
jgi:hypothetical protein